MSEKIRKLPSGSYHMQIRDPLNPKRRVSITEPSEAQCLARAQHYRGMRSDLAHGAVSAEDIASKLRGRAPLLVREVWESYVTSFDPARQRATKGLWEKHWTSFEGLSVHDLTAERMSTWEKWEGARTIVRGGERLRGLAVKTIKTLWSMLRAAIYRRIALRELRELPWGEWKPSGHWGRQREEREALRSIEEVVALLHAAREHDERVRQRGKYSDLYVKIAVMVFSGMRQGEAGALGWDDLEDLAGREGRMVTLRIRHQIKAHWREDHPEWKRPRYPPKAGSAGTIRLHDAAIRALDDHRGYLRGWNFFASDGPVFPNDQTGTWRSDETLLKPELLRVIAATAGIAVDLDRFTTHGLRHTFATLEAGATQDIVATAARTRHKDLRIVTQYMHATGRGLPASPLGRVDVGPPSGAHLLPPAPILTMTSEHGRELGDVRGDAEALRFVLDPTRDHHQVDAEEVSGLERIYHRWVEGGRRLVRPPEVTEGAERARSKAYVAALRRHAGEDREHAKKLAREAGVAAKRGYLGAWGKIARRLGEPVRALAKASDRTSSGSTASSPAPAPGGAVVLPFRRIAT